MVRPGIFSQAEVVAEHGFVDMDGGCDSDEAWTEALPTLIGSLGQLLRGEASPAWWWKAAGGATSACREIEQPLAARWALERMTTTAPAKRRSRQGDEKAAGVVADFCERQPALRVEPGEAELEALFAACRSLSSSAVSKAFREQLSWSNGDLRWQPRLRALCAMEHFSLRGTYGRDVVTRVVDKSSCVLEHLAREVPQCQAVAARLLRPAPMFPEGVPAGLELVGEHEGL